MCGDHPPHQACSSGDTPDDRPNRWTRRQIIAAGTGLITAGSATTANAVDVLRNFFGPASVATPAQRGPTTEHGLVPPEIFPRATWAGTHHPPRHTHAAERPYFFIVHHTVTPNTYSPAGALEQMRWAYRYQTGRSKGWPDVCYHFFVDRYGRIFEGRAGSLAGPVVGDATGGNQGHAQLVCLLGDFSRRLPTPEALDALTRLLAWLANRYKIPVGPGATAQVVSRGSNRWPPGHPITTPTIVPHRAMSLTECPGNAFSPYVEHTLPNTVAASLAQSLGS